MNLANQSWRTTSYSEPFARGEAATSWWSSLIDFALMAFGGATFDAALSQCVESRSGNVAHCVD